MKTLTLQQKIAQTFATHTDENTILKNLKTGIGAAKYMGFNGKKGGGGAAQTRHNIATRNKLQAEFLNASGLPISFINEGLHGGANGGTIFPMPVNQGAAWNKTLVHSIARVIAAESRSVGVDTVFAPVVNMITDPRFGRLQEGYSENPLITTILGEAAVLGLQNSAPPLTYLDNTSVASLGKHYAGYGAPSGGLNGGPNTFSKRTMYEIYLRPWKRMASNAGLRALMPAHNTVLDVPCHGNKWLIQDVLRDEFGFNSGITLSDCNDLGVLVDFRVAANRSHAASIGLKTGVDWDLQCENDPMQWTYNALPQALEEDLITESDLDKVVSRILIHKFASGIFDEGPVDADIAVKLLDNPKHRMLAKEAAEQSIVLLINKNGNTLPLSSSPHQRGKKVDINRDDDSSSSGLSIGLFGPTASSECNCSEATSSIIGSYSLDGAHVVTLDEALNGMDDGIIKSVEWEPGMASAAGPTGTGGSTEALNAAIDLAKRTDVAILILGDIQGKDYGGCGEWGDRDDLDLQGGQLELLEAVSTVANKTIVILIHGRPQTFGRGNQALNHVDALFAAWRPGEEFGNAMVSLLFGNVSPNAKLAQSWPRAVGQVGSGSSPFFQRVRGKWIANAKGAVDPDGRRYDNYLSSATQSPTPLFYFGFGLSYTKFVYHKLVVVETASTSSSGRSSSSVDDDVLWTAYVTLENIGNMYAGAEIVQIYIEDPVGLPFVPFWKRLIGFEKVFLDIGEIKTVEINILKEDVSMYNNDNQPTLTLFPGEYTLTAGGSSFNTTLSAKVTV